MAGGSYRPVRRVVFRNEKLGTIRNGRFTPSGVRARADPRVRSSRQEQHEEEEQDVSFRDKARRRLEERAQPAEPADDPGAPTTEDPEPESASAEPASAEPAYAGELEELAKLKDEGILTEEEFAAKKKQILGI